MRFIKYRIQAGFLKIKSKVEPTKLKGKESKESGSMGVIKFVCGKVFFVLVAIFLQMSKLDKIQTF